MDFRSETEILLEEKEIRKRYLGFSIPRLRIEGFTPYDYLPQFKRRVVRGISDGVCYTRTVVLLYKGKEVLIDTQSKVSKIRFLKISFQVCSNDSRKVEVGDIVMPVSVDSLGDFQALVVDGVMSERLVVILNGCKFIGCINCEEYIPLNVRHVDVIFDVITDDKYKALKKELKEVKEEKEIIENTLKLYKDTNTDRNKDFDELTKTYNDLLKSSKEEVRNLEEKIAILVDDRSLFESLKEERKKLIEDKANLVADMNGDIAYYKNRIVNITEDKRKLDEDIEVLKREKESLVSYYEKEIQSLEREKTELQYAITRPLKKGRGKITKSLCSLYDSMFCKERKITRIIPSAPPAPRFESYVHTPSVSTLVQLEDPATHHRCSFKVESPDSFVNPFSEVLATEAATTEAATGEAATSEDIIQSWYDAYINHVNNPDQVFCSEYQSW